MMNRTKVFKTRNIFLSSLILVVVFWSASLAEAGTAPAIRYTVGIKESAKQVFHVSMEFDEINGPNFELKMPIWMQGIYEIQKYGEQIQNFSAASAGQEKLNVAQTDDHTWLVSIPQKTSLKIDYDLDVGPAHKLFGKSYLDKQSALIHGGSFFLYNPQLRKNPISLKINLPEKWEAATALSSEKKNDDSDLSFHFSAQDYDELTDSPLMLGKFKRMDFTVAQIPFSVVVDSRVKHNAEELRNSAEKIAQREIEFFGSAPFERYLFLFYSTSDTSGSGLNSPMVGVEHQKSTLITVDPAVESFDGAKTIYREVEAHELFHAWNVKAIRPQALDFPNFDAPPVVRSLWLLEGFTQYYTQKILFQLYGNGNFDYFYQQINQGLFQAQLPASLEVISVNAPVESVKDFELLYTKGAVAGLLLDLKIRQATHNERGLDDFMHTLWQRYGLGKQDNRNHPYDEDKLLSILLEVAKAPDAAAELGQFYRHYIIGGSALPLKEYLAMAGWEVKGHGAKLPFLGISLMKRNWRIVDLDPEGNGALAGLQLGDMVIAVNGRALDDSSDMGELMTKLKESNKFKLTIERGNQHLEVEVKAVVNFILQPSISEVSKASEEQITRRKAISNLFDAKEN